MLQYPEDGDRKSGNEFEYEWLTCAWLGGNRLVSGSGGIRKGRARVRCIRAGCDRWQLELVLDAVVTHGIGVWATGTYSASQRRAGPILNAAFFFGQTFDKAVMKVSIWVSPPP